MKILKHEIILILKIDVFSLLIRYYAITFEYYIMNSKATYLPVKNV